jgi:ABC-2 type transport system ATP-binding protein
MRRRLDLAGALVAEPPVLFLDEPTTGLDPRSRTNMWEVIRELLRHGTTLLLTTQYLEEADRLADDIIVIDHGGPSRTAPPTSSRPRSAASASSWWWRPADLLTAHRLESGSRSASCTSTSTPTRCPPRSPAARRT